MVATPGECEFTAFSNGMTEQKNENLWIKNFSFPSDPVNKKPGPLGWWYPQMTLVLQRIVIQDHIVINYFFNFVAESYGRWTGDYTPYGYWMDVISNGATLRRYHLGALLISRAGNGFGPLQGPLPLTPVDFPEAFFAPINNVTIFGTGNQESR